MGFFEQMIIKNHSQTHLSIFKKMNHKITIGWTGPVSSKRYGGIVYGDQLIKILSKNTDLDFINIESRYLKNRYLKGLESLFYLFKLRGKKNLWIRNFYSTVAFSPNKTKGKNIAVVFHIDFSGFPLLSIPFLVLLEKLFFYHNLKKMDAIVTISEYWKNHFLEKGYPNVYKIYCGFDLNKFNISERETLDFKKKYKLEGKPIVYLGNCQKPKGVIDSYNALQNLDVYFVTSGRRQAKIPALNLNLEYREYLKLLKASSVAVTMSKFKEGWCMTTHEAMLSKTPVIGSGTGGMKELLEGGKQIICKDFRNLKEKVEYLLEYPQLREKTGKDGYNFAKEFTLERFEKEWINLVSKILLKI